MLRILEFRLSTERELKSGALVRGQQATSLPLFGFDVAFDRFCRGYVHPQTEGFVWMAHLATLTRGEGESKISTDRNRFLA